MSGDDLSQLSMCFATCPRNVRSGVVCIAERRMISKKIVESARFLKMPVVSQNLYFHLLVNADDDGIVEGFPVLSLCRADDKDLQILVEKGFVQILNEDLVTYIDDWLEHNKVRLDRKTDSIYQDLLLSVVPDVELRLKEPKEDNDSQMADTCQSSDSQVTAQDRVGEDREGKDSIDQDRKGKVIRTETEYPPDNQTDIVAQLGAEIITSETYQKLVKDYSEEIVQGVINKILSHPYTGKLNEMTIRLWCEEVVEEQKKKRRRYEIEEIERRLFNQ